MDQVRVEDLSGMGAYQEPYVISELTANANTVASKAGSARTGSTDPTFGIAEIKPYEMTVTSFVDRNLARLTPANYYAKVYRMAMKAMRRKLAGLIVNGDGETSRDFCYIDNVVQANLLASFATDEARNKVYNVAFGQRTTLNELFDLIREEVVRHMPEAATATATHRDFRAGDVRHSLADITRARTLLGYEPQFDVRTGLRLAGDWYAANL